MKYYEMHDEVYKGLRQRGMVTWDGQVDVESIYEHHINLELNKLEDKLLAYTKNVDSKNIIEAKLQVECKHFAPPWGKPGKDFNIETSKKLTKEIGYKSLATTERGLNFRGADTYNIKRDHMIAAWENYQLRYFL